MHGEYWQTENPWHEAMATLSKFLTNLPADQQPVAIAVRALAEVATELSSTIRHADPNAQLGSVRGSVMQMATIKSLIYWLMK